MIFIGIGLFVVFGILWVILMLLCDFHGSSKIEIFFSRK
jgi:hypothetical protein